MPKCKSNNNASGSDAASNNLKAQAERYHKKFLSSYKHARSHKPIVALRILIITLCNAPPGDTSRAMLTHNILSNSGFRKNKPFNNFRKYSIANFDSFSVPS